MAKKFDTNPLEADFPEKIKETQKKLETVALPENRNGKTRKFADVLETEDQTRKFAEPEFDTFQPTFGNPANQPANYQPQTLYDANANTKNHIKLGNISLPENVLLALPYIPFSVIGVVAGIIELIFIPKSEPRVRYHAAQGLAANLGVWLIIKILETAGFMMGSVADIADIFGIITTIILLVFAFKAFQGKPIHIEAVQDLTDWLEEKIKPQK